ncbi:DNA double-strand break repair nuclease NurA [Salsipaludibacter albus]|uniref:DNA double-strand break repair nuclease NurA n=1 Tax=Salsipaludibacter albus TaxID=2849650 RepID=UPI001EE3FB31|nr:DNA double-strand break repair nuclease NurA [Salsipaludibacter albus]
MRYAIDAWDPNYGAAVAPVLDQSTAPRDLDVERPERDWAPIAAGTTPAHDVLFVDGVRRIDARVWAVGDTHTAPALAVSVAAGAVRCNATARVVDTRVARFLVGRAGLAPITGSGLAWTPLAAADDDEATLVQAVQSEMGRLEALVAGDVPDADLVVLDGPLSGRTHLDDAVGYVKSHRMSYLPASVEGVVRRLGPGERTPVFLLQANWPRFSWYLRLPGGTGHPWAGVVRIEAPANVTEVGAAVALADVVGATLPRFASPAHRDARAPVNLLPIAGLEDTLHHLLGDRDLLTRRLRLAVAS